MHVSGQDDHDRVRRARHDLAQCLGHAPISPRRSFLGRSVEESHIEVAARVAQNPRPLDEVDHGTAGQTVLHGDVPERALEQGPKVVFLAPGLQIRLGTRFLTGWNLQGEHHLPSSLEDVARDGPGEGRGLPGAVDPSGEQNGSGLEQRFDPRDVRATRIAGARGRVQDREEEDGEHASPAAGRRASLHGLPL